jgi:hypothetical protein
MSKVLQHSANKCSPSVHEMVNPAFVKHANPCTQLIKSEPDVGIEPVSAMNKTPQNKRTMSHEAVVTQTNCIYVPYDALKAANQFQGIDVGV